ncbi:MAG TPA: hypothetical protein VHK91_17870 [Flavisolibacter sp.]|jgi:hypothetical protein|nr:hypothetical protein [Flavisolibacter sp.]
MTTLFDALIAEGFTPQQARLTILSIREWTQQHYPVLAAAANTDLRTPTRTLEEPSPYPSRQKGGSPQMETTERHVA